METLKEWRNVVDDLKNEWKTLWHDRINDRVRAEGIADRDYGKLFVDQGTVIVATRDYKPPDFKEILEKYKPPIECLASPSPHIGGWGKFMRNVLKRQNRFTTRRKPSQPEPNHRNKQQQKKGGKGWLHLKFQRNP